MKSVHLVIPDLFLPQEISKNVYSGLHLPALRKMLARGKATVLPRSIRHGLLEGALCELFGQAVAKDGSPADAPVAAVSARFDALGDGYWLRADPVHLHLDHSRMLLSAVSPSSEEAAAMCASLNEHFSGQGIAFFAPHPQRWYVRAEMPPRISTTPLSQVVGGDVRGCLPVGEDASRWHGIFNEAQMLLYSHPVNDAREARGEPSVNSVWLWGGGSVADLSLHRDHDSVSSDETIAEMFASVADVPFVHWADRWQGVQGRQLLVWTGLRTALQHGDLDAWRDALQHFETGYAQPLWQALRSGRIDRLVIDVLGDEGVRRIRLSRGDAWAFWRVGKALGNHALV